MSKRANLPIVYVTQKEASEIIKVKEVFIKKCSTENGFPARCKRQGEGFVYKISDVLAFAEMIDQEKIIIQ